MYLFIVLFIDLVILAVWTAVPEKNPYRTVLIVEPGAPGKEHEVCSDQLNNPCLWVFIIYQVQLSLLLWPSYEWYVGPSSGGQCCHCIQDTVDREAISRVQVHHISHLQLFDRCVGHPANSDAWYLPSTLTC